MSTRQNEIQIPATQAAERYIEHRREEVREKTVRGQATPVNRFAAWCEDNEKQLNQLNGLDLQEFYDYLRKHDQDYAKVTIRNYMTAVRQFIRWLEQLDAAPPGLADKVHMPTLEKEDRVRSEEIEPDRVQDIVEWLDKYRYASRDHVILLLLWRCGIRCGSIYSLDVQDFTELEDAGPAIQLRNRVETGTPLKNGEDGERPVNLRERSAEVVQDYIDTNRVDVEDDYGRNPLITSDYGRYSKDQIRKTVSYLTCPETTGIGTCECEVERTKEDAAECGESVSPHVIRSASITYWRRNDVPVEVVSGRMNVSRDVIEQHYDRRTEEGKARQRRSFTDSV